MNSVVRKSSFGIALLMSATLAGCGAAPTEAPAAGSGAKNCMVTDINGPDDRAFNQAAFTGLKEVAGTAGTPPTVVVSKTEADYDGNVSALVSQGCNIIVGVGFPLADAVNAAAAKSPAQNFALVDETSSEPNVKSLVFDTRQAAFLAGYAAASYSKAGIVGTYGGIQIPPIVQFMEGFTRGVSYFNEAHQKSVRVIGWESDTQNGTFVGGFEANEKAKTTAVGIIDQGADVIMPVGGPIFLAAAEAIHDSGKSVALIGVDSDAYESAPEIRDLFLTSVIKRVNVAVAKVAAESNSGKFNAEPYTGTLENDGVGIAPFHSFGSKVSPDLMAELGEVTSKIIDGTIAF
ncbi:BMP family ABC transporter substrate-binding protein [Mycetocola tolaasinivorans]|uniref:BMP family ABC transporter substrate-binding protein n=1 Tax=Mycetocola tolaasinivorans TaxID=76635 RepID=A0A3L7AB08_9MICO|nr:BMP family ABC transporter substrate-binding protein [Mycetocola tolaasinivorans]RLP77503.1 BMP family ABC transporter substrate-binding protein [Mycetocola tolaasinivorans]